MALPDEYVFASLSLTTEVEHGWRGGQLRFDGRNVTYVRSISLTSDGQDVPFTEVYLALPHHVERPGPQNDPGIMFVIASPTPNEEHTLTIDGVSWTFRAIDEPATPRNVTIDRFHQGEDFVVFGGSGLLNAEAPRMTGPKGPVKEVFGSIDDSRVTLSTRRLKPGRYTVELEGRVESFRIRRTGWFGSLIDALLP